MWRSCAVGLSSADAGEMETAAGYLPGVLVTWRAGARWERRREGGMVVVVKKAVTCHDWDAFPDLGEAGPWTAGVGYDHIMFHK